MIKYDRSATAALFDADADAYYDRNYKTEEGRHGQNLAIRRRVCRSLVDADPGVVLDLGCGPGSLAIPLLSVATLVYGLDLSFGMARAATNRARREPGAPFVFTCGDAVMLPFRSISFDLVTITGVIDYIAQPEELLSETRRILKPGGRLIISASSPRPIEIAVTRTLASLLSRSTKNVMVRQFSAPNFDDLLRRCGFSIAERRYAYMLPFPADVLAPSAIRTFDSCVRRIPIASLQRRMAKTYVVKATPTIA